MHELGLVSKSTSRYPISFISILFLPYVLYVKTSKKDVQNGKGARDPEIFYDTYQAITVLVVRDPYEPPSITVDV